MRSLLHLFPKPSRYTGIEDGVIRKDTENIRLRIALAFPDTYEVGMSYLGQKILYNIINARADWQAERVFAPEKQAAALLRDANVPLSTLETDTPLRSLDVVGFSITHELCYTDVLHMLDLAHIPLRHQDRSSDLTQCPLIIAGGGAMMGAEPLSPFFDLVCLGDGEELLPEVLELLQKAKQQRLSRKEFLEKASFIPGVYVPSLFEEMPDGSLKPLRPGYRPTRRVVTDLNKALYPVNQVTPIGAVHNRLSLEIARGCTRGCRFCHAGIVYRPARERSLENLGGLLDQALTKTGFEEVSFLALSAGDFSGLGSLWAQSWQRCAEEQISVSLPSLRVGSVDDTIMEKMAALRRTGCTLAPEAGSQRLRDVINKGISEADLLDHARKLLQHGWRQVKLYFMIGLPTETDEDLDAILELCKKTRDAGGKGAPKLAVTASLSPFVPKPFTPFQWEPQISLTEMRRRIDYCKGLFKTAKNLTLRWHNPEASHLEGILARADRSMAEVVEKAYHKGAVFCGWAEHFTLAPWLEALSESGRDPAKLIAGKAITDPLPWEHLESGVKKSFLERERKAALTGSTTPDCRYGACGACGACDTKTRPSLLRSNEKEKICHRLNFSTRDQQQDSSANIIPNKQSQPTLTPLLAQRQASYRVWHKKLGYHAYLSQLELQALLYRVFRRAKLPVAFSQGFHPLPLLSFGRALPVGLESGVEWFALTLAERLTPGKLMESLNSHLPKELRVWEVEEAAKKDKTKQASEEIFSYLPPSPDLLDAAWTAFNDFLQKDSWPYIKETAKGSRSLDIRPLLKRVNLNVHTAGAPALRFNLTWDTAYLSPLVLVKEIFSCNPSLRGQEIKIRKTAQIFPDYRKECHELLEKPKGEVIL